MWSNLKHVGNGVIIGVVVAIPMLAGIFYFTHIPAATPVPTSTAKPAESAPLHTPTYTSTPTLTVPTREGQTKIPDPSAAFTSSPIATPTLPVDWQEYLQNGSLREGGPLSPEQQVRLLVASQKFVRLNPEDSRRLGERINGSGYGSPSDICGPLSIAILQESGLLSSEIVPYDFWLLNPDVSLDRLRLEKTFPFPGFTSQRHKVKLKDFDWRANPLHPGDFLYLYAGKGGNFEHMLVVTRVDSANRAYSVTNHNTPEGFIISEVLLYDPDDPEAGMFNTWTERPNALLGSTGFAGYELWRRRASQKLLRNTLLESRP